MGGTNQAITLKIWQNHASRLDIWIFHVSRLSAWIDYRLLSGSWCQLYMLKINSEHRKMRAKQQHVKTGII
jgi:hypothetical protein